MVPDTHQLLDKVGVVEDMQWLADSTVGVAAELQYLRVA